VALLPLGGENKEKGKEKRNRNPNQSLNLDQWAFAGTLLLVGSCCSGKH
jgi:hypothetical protein